MEEKRSESSHPLNFKGILDECTDWTRRVKPGMARVLYKGEPLIESLGFISVGYQISHGEIDQECCGSDTIAFAKAFRI